MFRMYSEDFFLFLLVVSYIVSLVFENLLVLFYFIILLFIFSSLGVKVGNGKDRELVKGKFGI